MKMLYSLLDHNYRHRAPSPSKNLQEAVIRFMAETEEKEKYSKRSVNIVTMDYFVSVPYHNQ